jgi:hypothetical protein
MKRLMLLLLIGASGCQNADWQAQAVKDAEDLVRQQMNDPSAQFYRVQFTGDNRSGQTCGYFQAKTAEGGAVDTRFIVFIDGGGGQNPFIDDPSAPYPTNKDDFELNWRTQCVELGYSA